MNLKPREIAIAREQRKVRPEWTYGMAAKKLGITKEEYCAKIAAGLKWCTMCKTWHELQAFGKNRRAPDNLTPSCLRSLADSARARAARRPPKPRGPRRPYRCSFCESEEHTKPRCPAYAARRQRSA